MNIEIEALKYRLDGARETVKHFERKGDKDAITCWQNEINRLEKEVDKVIRRLENFIEKKPNSNCAIAVKATIIAIREFTEVY